MKKTIAAIVALSLCIALALAVTYTRTTASADLLKAESQAAALKKAGFDIPRINDLLKEAKISFEKKDYQKTGELANEIITLTQKVLYVSKKINETQILIDASRKLGPEVSQIQEMINSAQYEFNLENFEESFAYVNQASENIVRIYGEEFNSVIQKLENLNEQLKKEGIESIKIRDTIESAKKANTTVDALRLSLLYEEVNNLNKSTQILINAKRDIEMLQESNLPLSRVNDTYNEAKLALELGESTAVEELGKEITLIKKAAIEVREKLTSVDSKISAAKGLDLSQARTLYAEALKNYENEDFDSAGALLEKANKEIEGKISDSLLFGIVEKNKVRFSIIKFLKEYWWLLLVVLITLAAVFCFSYGMISAKIVKNQIERLKKEEKILTDLMKTAQTDYFINKKIARQLYEQLMDKHERRMIQIKEKIPVLASKLKEKNEHHLFPNRKAFKSGHE